VTSTPALQPREHVDSRRFALPPIPGRSSCAMEVVNTVGREVRPDVVSPGNREIPRSLRTPGDTSPAGVCAAQGGEARQGGGRGELPASPTASPTGPVTVRRGVPPEALSA
jgi:hypothetical protein